MTERHTSSGNLNETIGAILLSFGLLLLFTNLGGIAMQVSDSFVSTAGSPGTVVALGLAALRTVQTYLFDPSTFQADLRGILVSCWPLILVIIGAVLLQNAISRRFVSSGVRASFPLKGSPEMTRHQDQGTRASGRSIL